MDRCIEPLVPPLLSAPARRTRGKGTSGSWAIWLLRMMIAIVLRGWLKFAHRLSIDGIEHLPSEGSFILIANHASHLDTLCLQAIFPLRKLHRVFSAASATYFFCSLHRWAAAVIVANALPIHRRMHLRESLTDCRKLLAARGNVLILYPEGTRSTNGQMGSFRPGIGALVAGTAIPVIPCYLKGAGSALAKGRWFPRPFRIRLRIGEALTYPFIASDRASHQFVARDLEQAVRELSFSMSAGSLSKPTAPTLSPSTALFAGNKI